MAIVVNRSITSSDEQVQKTINLVYPVGSYYQTSDSSFDPNVSWVGTWSSTTANSIVTWHRTA